MAPTRAKLYKDPAGWWYLEVHKQCNIFVGYSTQYEAEQRAKAYLSSWNINLTLEVVE